MSRPRLVQLPKDTRIRWSPKAFVAHLPQVVLDVAQVRCGLTVRALLKENILAKSNHRKSFLAIGRSLGITKQATDIVWKVFLRRLRRTMIQNDYKGYRFRFTPRFVQPIRDLSTTLKGRELLSEGDWNKLLARTWNMKASDLGATEKLILEILGLRRFDFERPVGLIPIIGVTQSKTRLQKAARGIQRILLENPRGASLSQIARRLCLDKREVRVLLQSMRNITGHGKLYRVPVRIDRNDQYYRILKDARKPLHYREMARRAERFGYYGNYESSSVSNILIPDERFVPVGQSGCWALAEWKHVETRTIIQIVFDEMKKANRPLRENELCELIQRKTKRNSLRTMLSKDARFRYLGSTSWTLAI